MGLVHHVARACRLGVPSNLRHYLPWRRQRGAALDPNRIPVTGGAPPSLQEVLPKIAKIGEFLFPFTPKLDYPSS